MTLTNPKPALFVPFVLLLAGPAFADSFTLSGFLDDAGNLALASSDPGAPSFVDDFDIANNVALYDLSITVPGTFSFEGVGFGLGGIDPYFTLFEGTGSGATFFGSNFFEAFSTGGDFSIDFVLAAGDHTVAIGAFANMSFAENFGIGTLGDGFVGLGQPDFLGNYYYQINVESTDGEGAPVGEGPPPPVTVPEPLTVWLVGLGLAGVLTRSNQTRRR
jgi:hypothetical protein